MAVYNGINYDPKKDYAQAIIDAKQGGADWPIIEYLERERAAKIAAASDEKLAKYGTNRAGQSSKIPQLPHGPVTLSRAEMMTLMQQDCKNDITVISGDDGSAYRLLGYILNGYTYLPQSNSTGMRMLDYGEGAGKGIYLYQDIDNPSTMWTAQVHDAIGPDGKKHTYRGFTMMTLKAKQKPRNPVVVPPVEVVPPAPKPSFIPMNAQPPTFTADLKTMNKYTYFFGLDKLSMKYVIPNTTCCFVSKEIDIGNLFDDTYLELTANVSEDDNSSVELYIIDSGKEVPILLAGVTEVKNEKIFSGLKTRFIIDTTQSVVIKRNGIVSDVTLDKAMISTDALYTVDYTPLKANDYKPYSSLIKVKVILRLYNSNYHAPYASKIRVRKYGGEALWQ